MCRFSIYKGRLFRIGDLITKPENSLIYQSRDATYHPGCIDKFHKRNIAVNGDGFGLAWYGDDASQGSCCCKFVTPAWSNTNLRNLGEYVSARLIMAHVRAASSGHNPFEDVTISFESCHPFKYGRYTYMVSKPPIYF
jgi:predicted glutamine amidotransferase